MPWWQIELEAGAADPQRLADFLQAQGAISVTLTDAADQPLFEPEPGTTPLWSATRITALFELETAPGILREALAEQFGASLAERARESVLEDQDWERVWLERFRPMRFGQRLWVCPAGQRPRAEPDPVIVDLDPGLAFGTGTHPTTALCLEWLDAHPPAGHAVLDYGSGSGILAVAALKLGAERLWAVDIDPQALQSTRDNATRNGVEGGLSVGLPDALPADAVFDLLLANILANPLIELAPALAGRVKPGGDILLSGILAQQAEAVRTAYAPWFALDDAVAREDWVRI
ncbi:MAG TPA: 50S ribosomal protein L11 methyltransferase, partial [Thiotrichales bacterium]|nr:50S ribosomal protein L11 methyltransferase [Thiotrichales bacterium]